LEADFAYLEATIKDDGDKGSITRLNHQNWLKVFYFW
jgi:hypothetical protein